MNHSLSNALAVFLLLAAISANAQVPGDSGRAPRLVPAGSRYFPMDTAQKNETGPAPVLAPAPREDYLKAIDTADEKGVRALNERFAKINRKADGIGYYRKYLGEHPDSEKAKMGLAQLLGWDNQFDEAQKAYRSVLADHPENEEAAMGLGLVLAWANRFQEAESIFVTLYAKNPENIDAKINHARLMSWQGHWDVAVEELQGVLRGFPSNLYAHEALAFIYKWKHNYHEAYRHFTAITKLDGDSAVILNALYQTAELDFWQGRNQMAIARLSAVLAKYPDPRRFSDKLDEINKFLRPHFSVNLYRYQEVGQNEGSSSFSGSGNNGLTLGFEKNLSLLATLKAEYQLRNEVADQFSPVKADVRLYNVGVQTLHIEPEFRYKDSAVFHVFYAPSVYWNRDTALPSLKEETVFHGLGIFGTLKTFTRLYWGITRTPWISNNNSHLEILARYSGNAGTLFRLNAKNELSVSAMLHIYEDRNVLQEYQVEVVRTLSPRFQWINRGFAKFYHDQVPDYFTYRYWGSVESALSAEQQISRLRLRGEAFAGFNALQQGPDAQKKFGSFGLKLHPSFRFMERHETALSLSGLINTDGYYLYYAGLRYGF